MSEMNLNRIRALRPLASRDYRLLFAAVGIEVFGTAVDEAAAHLRARRAHAALELVSRP